jgi:hypothetical protein
MRIERARADVQRVDQFRSLANFLASSSLRNVSVALARFRFPHGSSNETYHVRWDLLAMIPSRGLRRRSPRWAGPQSKANEIVPHLLALKIRFLHRPVSDSLPA